MRKADTQEAFRPEGSTLVAISAGTKTVCSSARTSPSKISASRRWMRRFSGLLSRDRTRRVGREGVEIQTRESAALALV